jgi:hypothetical protein
MNQLEQAPRFEKVQLQSAGTTSQAGRERAEIEAQWSRSAP